MSLILAPIRLGQALSLRENPTRLDDDTRLYRGAYQTCEGSDPATFDRILRAFLRVKTWSVAVVVTKTFTSLVPDQNGNLPQPVVTDLDVAEILLETRPDVPVVGGLGGGTPRGDTELSSLATLAGAVLKNSPAYADTGEVGRNSTFLEMFLGPNGGNPPDPAFPWFLGFHLRVALDVRAYQDTPAQYGPPPSPGAVGAETLLVSSPSGDGSTPPRPVTFLKGAQGDDTYRADLSTARIVNPKHQVPDGGPAPGTYGYQFYPPQDYTEYVIKSIEVTPQQYFTWEGTYDADTGAPA